MLCSGAELGLGEESSGILDLPADAPTGQAYALYAGLDDPGHRDQPHSEPPGL